MLNNCTVSLIISHINFPEIKEPKISMVAPDPEPHVDQVFPTLSQYFSLTLEGLLKTPPAHLRPVIRERGNAVISVLWGLSASHSKVYVKCL